MGTWISPCLVLGVGLTLTALVPARAAAEEPRLPLIEPGRHPVGWKAFVRPDFSRPYIDCFAGPAWAKSPRPILFAVWYPALRQEKAFLKLGDYLRLEGVSPPHAKFLQRLATVGRQVVTQEISDTPEEWLSQTESQLADRHLDRPTLATRAPPAAGRFPLLIYHPGLRGFFADSAPLLEHLASHGYVVVSSAFQPVGPESVLIDADIDRSRRDIEFILSEMRQEAQVDLAHVGLLGHSFGASAALATTLRNGSVDAVVSIDSTLDYQRIRDLPLEGDWAVFAEPQRLRAPSLFFAQKEGVRFDLVKSFTGSERLLVEIPGVDHGSFIWHGPSGAALRGDPTAAVKTQAYRTVMLIVQQFLDAHLKQNDRAIAFLATQSEEGRGFRFERLPASKPLPSATELGAALLARGAGASQGIVWLESVVKKDSLPFPVLQDLITTLREREQPVAAKAVAELSARIYADNFRAMEILGDLQVKDRELDRATTSYRNALQRLRPARIRPFEMKTRLRDRLNRKLERLKKATTP
jgi:dienelactone hydrolase